MLRHFLLFLVGLSIILVISSCIRYSDDVEITVDKLSVCGFYHTRVEIDNSGTITASADGEGAECLQPVVPEGSAENWKKALDAIKEASTKEMMKDSSSIEINGVKIAKTSTGFVVSVE